MGPSSSSRDCSSSSSLGSPRAFSALSITLLVLHSAVSDVSAAASNTSGLSNTTNAALNNISTAASHSSASSSHSSSAASHSSASTSSSSISSSSSSSSHGSSHHQWHSHGYEYSFVECIILVVLISMALLFEVLFHTLLHEVEHSYEYGIPRSLRQGHHHKKKSCWSVLMNNPFSTEGRVVPTRKNAAKHKHVHKDESHDHEHELGHANDDHDHGHGGRHAHGKLWKQLVARAGGEFMILGFLALAVYLFNKAGGFDKLPVGVLSDGFHLPDSGTAWLHMTEDVHMKLFFAMMIYFVSASHMLYGVISRLMTLEKLQNHVFTRTSLRNAALETLQISSGGLWHCLLCTETANGWISRGRTYDSEALVLEYSTLREFCINRIMGWESSWPEAFAEVVEALDIQAPHEPLQIRSSLDDRFAFSNYWALIMEEAISDMIQMPTRTWLCLIFEVIVFGALLRTGINFDWILFAILFFMAVVTICILFSLAVIWGRRRHILSSESKVECPGEERGLARCLRKCARTKLETYIMWGWEVVRFSCIYQMAWIIFDFFLGFRKYSAGTILLFLGIFGFELALLGFSSVIDMYFVLALPPFIDEGNLDTLIHVLRDTRKFRIDGESRAHQHQSMRQLAEDTEQLLAPELLGNPAVSEPELPGQTPPAMESH